MVVIVMPLPVPTPKGRPSRPPFREALFRYIVPHPSSSLVRSDGLMRSPFLMSGKTNGNDGEASVITKTRSKTQRPPLYKVLLLNDDYTPMEFVVHVLERFFGLTHAQAFEIMLTVHKKGLAVVGVFSFDGPF
jgi:ATP-dependent Clp protease adaptor protein ClpS